MHVQVALLELFQLDQVQASVDSQVHLILLDLILQDPWIRQLLTRGHELEHGAFHTGFELWIVLFIFLDGKHGLVHIVVMGNQALHLGQIGRFLEVIQHQLRKGFGLVCVVFVFVWVVVS